MEPPAPLADADLVYILKGRQLQPLGQPYSGHYKVLEKGPKYFRFDIGGKDTVVTVECLKPHIGAAGTTPAAPQRWGCLPREKPATPASPSTPATPARTPSPGLPATTGARPAVCAEVWGE